MLNGINGDYLDMNIGITIKNIIWDYIYIYISNIDFKTPFYVLTNMLLTFCAPQGNTLTFIISEFC